MAIPLLPRPLRLFPLALCLLFAGCTTIGNSGGNMGYRTFTVQGNKIGLQFTPRQITRMLEDMGYERLEVKEYVPQYGDNSQDTGTRVSSELIESIVDYRMVFRADDLPSMLVRVRIIKSTGGIHVGVIEGESKQLSPAARAKVDKMVAAFANLYGPENVHYKG